MALMGAFRPKYHVIKENNWSFSKQSFVIFVPHVHGWQLVFRIYMPWLVIRRGQPNFASQPLKQHGKQQPTGYKPQCLIGEAADASDGRYLIVSAVLWVS